MKHGLVVILADAVSLTSISIRPLFNFSQTRMSNADIINDKNVPGTLFNTHCISKINDSDYSNHTTILLIIIDVKYKSKATLFYIFF